MFDTQQFDWLKLKLIILTDNKNNNINNKINNKE